MIIDIVLNHEGQQFSFTAELEVIAHPTMVQELLEGSELTLTPMTSINGIGDYCPDTDQPAAQGIDAITEMHMKIWIQQYSGNSDVDHVIKEFNEYFNIEAE